MVVKSDLAIIIIGVPSYVPINNTCIHIVMLIIWYVTNNYNYTFGVKKGGGGVVAVGVTTYYIAELMASW